MASAWIEKREGKTGVRFRVCYRTAGWAKDSYGGSFKTKREALARKAWINGELAAMRIPDVRILGESKRSPTLTEAAERWRSSRVDVTESTRVLHRVALDRVLPILGTRRVDDITTADVAALIAELHAAGYKRATIRKSLTYLAQVLDHAGIQPNPARDRIQVKLPREEREELEPPTASHVAAVYRTVPSVHRLPLLFLDWSGARVKAVDTLLVGDYDEPGSRVRLRAATTKTRRALPLGGVAPGPRRSAFSGSRPARGSRPGRSPIRGLGFGRAANVNREGVQGARDSAVVASRPPPSANLAPASEGRPLGAHRRAGRPERSGSHREYLFTRHARRGRARLRGALDSRCGFLDDDDRHFGSRSSSMMANASAAAGPSGPLVKPSRRLRYGWNTG